MHGLDRRLDVAIGRQHDRRRHVAAFPQTLQEPEAVHARHVEVGHNHVGGKLSQLLQRFVAVRGRLGSHAPGRHHGCQAAALAGFVIHDENFYSLIQQVCP